MWFLLFLILLLLIGLEILYIRRKPDYSAIEELGLSRSFIFLFMLLGYLNFAIIKILNHYDLKCYKYLGISLIIVASSFYYRRLRKIITVKSEMYFDFLAYASFLFLLIWGLFEFIFFWVCVFD